MTFADLLAGDAVFLDANTFVYHFAPDPRWSAPCGQLLLTKLASNDTDFDRVPGLTRYAPV